MLWKPPQRLLLKKVMMRKYKNLFFDLDGTISDSYAGITALFRKTFAKFSINVPEDDYRSFVGPPIQTTFSKYFKDPLIIPAAKEYFRKLYFGNNRDCTAFEGIAEVLKELKKRGYKIYTATSKREDQAIDVCDYLGVAEYFNKIYGADGETRIEKEHVLQYAVESSGAKLSESVLIGDTYFDLYGAKFVGMDCIWASYGYGTKESIAGLPYVAEIKNTRELLRIL